jgi:toxin YoeB
MGRYPLEIIGKAKKELAERYKIGNKAVLKRLERIFEELEAHPMIWIGSPERLKHQFSGFWSKKINL